MQEKKRTPFDYINGVFLLLLAIVTAFPLYYVLIISVGSYKDIVTSNMYLFPSSFLKPGGSVPPSLFPCSSP